MGKALAYVFGGIIVIGLVGSVSYGIWQVSRKWNYHFSYKSMVQETVREMVKESAIRAPKEK